MKIEVQKQWWPEMEFLNLPLTECVDKTNTEFVDDVYPFDTNILRHYIRDSKDNISATIAVEFAPKVAML